MKAAAFFGKKDIRLVRVNKPKVDDNGVLIKMKACGICGSDMHVYHSDILTEDSTKEIEKYRIIGHEFTGEIVEAGKHVTEFKVGDRVASVHNKGGMAEYIAVNGEKLKNLYKIPEGLSFETAATLEPFCNPTHSFHLREPKDHETVAIFGSGMIGIGYLQNVKARTKARTIVVDVSPLRLEMAKKCGSDIIIDAKKEDVTKIIKEHTGDSYVRYQDKTAGGCDIAVDCAGLPLTFLQCLEVINPENGTVIVAAVYEKDVSLDPNMILFKYMTIFGSMGYYDWETKEALDLIASGKVNRDILITHKIPLDNVIEGFDLQGNPYESFKVIIVDK
jgi:threonine dehydrogenase-like Zn-dependent dehydrogenase